MCPMVAARQPRELVEISLLWWSWVSQVQFVSEHMPFLVSCLGRSQDSFICLVLCALPLVLTLSHRPCIPMKRSICSIDSIKAFLCGRVGFTTGLRASVDSSRFSVISVVCVVIITIVGIFIVRVRVCSIIVVLTVNITALFCCFHLFLFCVDGIVFFSGLNFCSGDMSVWILQGLVSRHVAFKFLSVNHPGLPNRSALTLSHDATQSVHK